MNIQVPLFVSYFLFHLAGVGLGMGLMVNLDNSFVWGMIVCILLMGLVSYLMNRVWLRSIGKGAVAVSAQTCYGKAEELLTKLGRTPDPHIRNQIKNALLDWQEDLREEYRMNALTGDNENV